MSKMTVLLSLLLGSSLAFALGESGNPNVDYREYDYNALEKMVIKNTSGRIAISPMAVNKVEITSSKRKWSERCSLDITRDDIAVITVRVEKPLGENCEVDFDVRVPKTVSLDLTSNSGTVTVDGVEGKLHFDLGSGSLKAAGKFSAVDGKTGSGSVDVKGIDGPANVVVGSGEVKLAFNAESKGEVSVKSGSGNTFLMFPKGTKLKTALSTGSGQLSNDFSNATLAPDRNVNASTGSGDLNVETY